MEAPREVYPTAVPWRRSLVTRLGWAFILIVILSLIIVGVGLIGIARQAQRQSVFQLQERNADRVALLISSYVGRAVEELHLFEGLESLGAMSPTAQKGAMENLLIQHPTLFSQLVLADRKGTEVARVSQFYTYLPGDLGSQAGSDPFVTASRGQTYVGPVFVSPDSGLLSVRVAVPVRAPGQGIVNVLIAEVNVARLWQEVSRIGIGQTGYAYLVDKAGRFVAYQEVARVLQRYGEDMRHMPPVQEFMAGGAQKAGRVQEYVGLVGERVIGLYVPVEGTDWAVIVEWPTREAFAGVTRMQWYLVGLAFVGIVAASGLAVAVSRRLVYPIRELTAGAAAIAAGDLSRTAPAPPGSEDEITILARAFNHMTGQLRDLIGSLEQQVAERTRGLQAAAEVARATTSLLDPDVLLHQVVELVRERFDLYYVGLFLLDEDRRFALLRAGTGEAGRQMLAQKHRLEVGGESMIGRCIADGRARIALDVGEEPYRFDNPLLPQTRSELALPLRARGVVIGAMTVQSSEAAAFDEADIAVMQTMADQVAVALDNARLFQETQAALAELEAVQRRYLGQAWSVYTAARASSGYEQSETGLVPLGGEILPEARRALAKGRALLLQRDGGLEAGGGAGSSVLVAPILLRDQPLGVLGFQQAEGRAPWGSEEVALAEMVAEQFALAADNLRLLDETQRRAARERTIREIADQMQRAASLEALMHITAEELNRALGGSRAYVRLIGEMQPEEET